METTIIRMSLGGAILIAVIVLIRLVGLNKLPKRLFPALWCLALLRLLTPLSVTVPAGVPLPAIPIPVRQVVELPDVSAPADNAGHPGITTAPGTVPSTAPARPADAPSQDTGSKNVSFPIVPTVWAAVGLGLGLYFAVSRIRLCRELRTAVPVENEFASRWLAEQRPRRRVELRELAGLPSPLTYGIIRPVILVPRAFDWSDTVGAGYVLYHEYTHIRRFDAALKLLMAVALCLHWFNPMVWVMYFLFDRDLELACDEAVLRHYGPGMRRDYAETIIGMEEKRALPAPFGSFFSKNTAEERIQAIMKFRKNSVIALALALVLVLAGAVTVFATASGDEKAPPVNGGAKGTFDTVGATDTNDTDDTNGTDDTNDTSGTNGTDGTDDTDGTNDTNGTNGTDDTSGTNGTGGTDGTDDTNGTTEGTSGTISGFTMDWAWEHAEELSDRELIDFASRADGAYAEEAGCELARRFDADPQRLLRALAEEKEINVDGAIDLLAGEWIIAGTPSPLDGVAELELTEAERGILDDITAEYENSLAQYLS